MFAPVKRSVIWGTSVYVRARTHECVCFSRLCALEGGRPGGRSKGSPGAKLVKFTDFKEQFTEMCSMRAKILVMLVAVALKTKTPLDAHPFHPEACTVCDRHQQVLGRALFCLC